MKSDKFLNSTELAKSTQPPSEPLCCPFCGSTKLKIDSKRSFMHGGKRHCSVTVRCKCCFARGPVASIDLPDGQFNERELMKSDAYKLWNSRV